MNELSCIQAFVSIVENGTQLEAARQLNQSSAAINKKLAKLESKLGVQLLERDTKTSVLTAMGERYYHAYFEILDKLADANQLANQDKTKPQGRLMISMSQAIASTFIIPKLSAFLKAYPAIFLVFDIADKTVDYVPGKQDILIGADVMLHENLVRKKLTTTRDILCATPQYIKRLGKPVKKLSDLHQMHYIGYCMRSPINKITLSSTQSLEINKPYIRTNDEHIAIQIALQDTGFIYVKEYLITKQLESGVLVELLADINKSKINLAMHYHYQQYINPKIKAFIDFFSK